MTAPPAGRINRASARRIGLFEFPVEQVEPAGNTALRGAKLALFELPVDDGRFAALRRRIEHVALRDDPGFHDAYIEAMGFPGQPSHPICHGVGDRGHEPPWAHQAGVGEIAESMILAIEPGCYREGGGGLRVEDNFLITADGAEKLSPFPDGIVEA